jgi:hypothetical protein
MVVVVVFVVIVNVNNQTILPIQVVTVVKRIVVKDRRVSSVALEC